MLEVTSKKEGEKVVTGLNLREKVEYQKTQGLSELASSTDSFIAKNKEKLEKWGDKEEVSDAKVDKVKDDFLKIIDPKGNERANMKLTITADKNTKSALLTNDKGEEYIEGLIYYKNVNAAFNYNIDTKKFKIASKEVSTAAEVLDKIKW